jgi:hypothetical protein
MFMGFSLLDDVFAPTGGPVWASRLGFAFGFRRVGPISFGYMTVFWKKTNVNLCFSHRDNRSRCDEAILRPVRFADAKQAGDGSSPGPKRADDSDRSQEIALTAA